MHKLFLLKIGGPEIILITFFIVIPATLTILAILDILRSKFGGKNTRSLWLLFVLFAPVLGPLVYLLVGRTKKIKS